MCRWFDSAPGHQHPCALAPFSGPRAFLQFGVFFYNYPMATRKKSVESLSHPRPPKGYKTWLDYAVSTMDTREALHDQLWHAPKGATLFDRDEMYAAAIAELDELRSAAGVADTFPKKRRAMQVNVVA